MTQKRRIETAGFRPTSEEEELLLAAEAATGRQRSELLRRCLTMSIRAVVQEILSSHEAAVANFERLTAQALHADPPPYKPKPPPKQRAG